MQSFELILAILGTGVALAALQLAQGSALRSEVSELRREMGAVRERLARLEGVLDIIRSGMQLPRPEETADPPPPPLKTP